MSDTISTATILGIKIDTQTTKLFLFDVVDAKYTLLATSEAKTTHSAPYNDIREGLFKAIDHLQKVTGKFILDNEMNIIFPSLEDGNGVDLISISYGFLNFASIITAGLLENVSIESNANLIQLTHLSHLDQISLNDSRTLEEVFNSIQNKRPDILLLSGGTENGTTKSVIRLLEIILFCTKNLPAKEIPEFIFAGNSQLGEKFEEVLTKNAKNQKKVIEYNNLDILTRNEVAELLKVSTVTLHHWAKKKVLVPFSIATRVYYKKKDITDAMKEGHNI